MKSSGRLPPLALAPLCLAAGCIEDLSPKDVVAGPRILDIIADRPELNPGDATTLRVMLAGTTGAPTYRWHACISTDATRSGMSLSNFGENNTFSGCFGDAGANTPLGTRSTATFRVPREMLQNLQALTARFGGLLPADVLDSLARDIGLVVGIAVEVDVDGVTLQGYKRVVVSLNPRVNTNPPPPRVEVNRVWVSVPSGEDSVCVPENGMPLRAARGQRVDLVPDPDERRWIEPYRVLTASGQLVDREETAFYSWYVSGGRMARSLTRSPIRNNIWGAPDAPGEQTMWILLRDGHGGTSGCRLTLLVE